MLCPDPCMTSGFDATISRHDLAETYLEQFRIAITEANPLGYDDGNIPFFLFLVLCSVSPCPLPAAL